MLSDLDRRQFERWSQELSDGALELFDRLGELHLSTDRREMREFAWHVNGPISAMSWLARSNRVRIDHARSDIQELVDAHVVRRAAGRGHYRLDARAVRFHEWRSENVAPEPIQLVERLGVLSISESGGLVRRHPTVARHLRDARQRLGTDELDDAALIAIGASLRAALAGMAADLVGYDGGDPEKAANLLGPWLSTAEAEGRLPPRQSGALTELVRMTARCCQRLDHLRNERSKGEREPTWEEARRTLFLTVTCCYELDRI